MFTAMQSMSHLENEIDHLFKKLRSHGVDTEEYNTILDRIIKLHKLRTETSRQVSPDTLVLAGTNIFGIFLILNYERLNLISTKALGLLRRV